MWKNANTVRSNLEASIGTLLEQHHKVFPGGESEPRRVKTLITDTFVSGLENAISDEMDGWSAFAMGGWIDHYPQANFNGDAAELGDLLLVLAIAGAAPTTKRAILFQAKRFGQTASVPDHEPAQLKLYQDWPPFKMSGKPGKKKGATTSSGGKAMGEYDIIPPNDHHSKKRHGKYLLVKTEASQGDRHDDLWKWFEPEVGSACAGSFASAIAEFVLQHADVGRAFSYRLPPGWMPRKRCIDPSKAGVNPQKLGWDEMISVLVSYAEKRKIGNVDTSKIGMPGNLAAVANEKQGQAGAVMTQGARREICSMMQSGYVRCVEVVEERLHEYCRQTGYFNVDFLDINLLARFLVDPVWKLPPYYSDRRIGGAWDGPPDDSDRRFDEADPPQGMAVLHVTLLPVPPKRRD